MRASNAPLAQLAQDLHALDGVEVGVEPLGAHPLFLQEAREVLRHPLRQRGDEDALPLLGPLADLDQQGRHLAARRLDAHHRVDEAGGPDELLDHFAARHGRLVVARRGRDVHALAQLLLPLVEPQRAVVQGAGQPEPVLDQRALAAEVAGEHAPDLRHADVRLVQEQQAVGREEVEQRVGRLARLAARQRAAVVLDPRTVADLQQHLNVIARAGGEALGLQQLALLLHRLEAFLQFLLDRLDRAFNTRLGQDEVLGRID